MILCWCRMFSLKSWGKNNSRHLNIILPTQCKRICSFSWLARHYLCPDVTKESATKCKKCLLRRIKPGLSFVHFLFYRKSLATAALLVITSSSWKLCWSNTQWKISLLVLLRKISPLYQVWEWDLLPVLCYNERNSFYSTAAEETSFPEADSANCLLSFCRTGEGWSPSTHVQVLLVKGRVGSCLAFSLIIYFLSAGFAKILINSVCKPCSFSYHFSSQNF